MYPDKPATAKSFDPAIYLPERLRDYMRSPRRESGQGENGRILLGGFR